MDTPDTDFTQDRHERLQQWFARQLPNAGDLRIGGLEHVAFGHSAETLLLTVETHDAEGVRQQLDVVVRVCPRPPGLLPPYDLQRQSQLLRALAPTDVRAPRALWYEPDTTILGQDFYVMERIDGDVYEQSVPDGIADDPERLQRMCFALIEQLAAIHLVDLEATGLNPNGGGADFLDQQLNHWESEIRRLQRGALPALERLAQALREQQPAPCPQITLVHGDAKPGNFMYVGAEVSAVLDWELTTVGDPLADLGWLELMWGFPVGLPTVAGVPTIDQLIARYQELTGITVQNRAWYRAFQGFKMAVINLSGSMMLDRGDSDDPKLIVLGYAVPYLTDMALRELGIAADLESGPVQPRPERIAAVQANALT